MNRRLKRWLSVVMLATLALSHVSLALAACAMDRGQLAQMMSQSAEHECCDDATAPVGPDAMPMATTACLSQSTSDLQAFGIPPSIDQAPAAAVLVLPSPDLTWVVASRWSAPPPKTVPPRILLHSFLI
jgi:hypothetical protein